MKKIRKVSCADHVDRWYLITDQFPSGVDYGPIFSKRTIKKWEKEYGVVGHRTYTHADTIIEEWRPY